MNPCLLIPIYDHGQTIDRVVLSLAHFGLPLLIVDDGSHVSTKQELQRIAAREPWITLLRRDLNGGRGAALKDGYRLAHEIGFTHAIQLDADGQHAATDVPRMLNALKAHPEALVLGAPIFDSSIPKARLYGRQLSRVMVWISTLSFAVEDPLCGFRGVPLQPTIELLGVAKTGDHMEFDPEFCVRLAWSGTRVVNVPTRVVYDPMGLSHFDTLRDNLRLTWTYTRLLGGAVFRSPSLLRNRQKKATHD